MVRAFSLPSKGLAYLVGYTLVHAETVAICSPWVSDVTLHLPVTDALDTRRLTLTDALERLPETDVRIYVRAGETHNRYVRNRLASEVTLIEVEDLHAKAVVSPEYVYVGSANITRGGFVTNVEYCEIVENEYDSVDGFLTHELALTG